jgi:hypothetical protein
MQLNSMEHIEKLKKGHKVVLTIHTWLAEYLIFPIPLHYSAWRCLTFTYKASDHLYLCAYPDASISDIKNWTHRYLYVYRHRITFYNHTFLDLWWFTYQKWWLSGLQPPQSYQRLSLRLSLCRHTAPGMWKFAAFLAEPGDCWEFSPRKTEDSDGPKSEMVYL